MILNNVFLDDFQLMLLQDLYLNGYYLMIFIQYYYKISNKI